jgi:hypothetical protein
MLRSDDLSDVPADRAAEELHSELVELQRLVMQLMDRLAEQVLDQIQNTRTMADETDSARAKLRASLPTEDDAAHLSEAHLRRLSRRFNDALRDLPEYQWDNFADTCIQIGQMLQRAERSADGGA